MKKPASKIRQEIARLQEQLKDAETRDAERIGRIAVKAGLADEDIEEAELLAAFEDLGRRFRRGELVDRREGKGFRSPRGQEASPIAPRPIAGAAGEG